MILEVKKQPGNYLDGPWFLATIVDDTHNVRVVRGASAHNRAARRALRAYRSAMKSRSKCACCHGEHGDN